MLGQFLICSSACAELGQTLLTAAGVIPMFILQFAPLPELCLAALAPGKASLPAAGGISDSCDGVSPCVYVVPVWAWIYGKGKKGWEEGSGCVWVV